MLLAKTKLRYALDQRFPPWTPSPAADFSAGKQTWWSSASSWLKEPVALPENTFNSFLNLYSSLYWNKCHFKKIVRKRVPVSSGQQKGRALPVNAGFVLQLADVVPHQTQEFKSSAGLARPQNLLRNCFIISRDLHGFVDTKSHTYSQEGATSRTLPLLIKGENTAFPVFLGMNAEWKGQIQKLMAGQRFSWARVKIKSCGVRKKKGPKCPQNFHMTFRYQ